MKTYNDSIFNFENLEVYQKSLDYIDFVYTVSGKFPKHEMYDLGQQFRRASKSIALNLGEGEGGTDNEYLNFLRISRRSVQECVVCTTVAQRRKYISQEEVDVSRQRLAQLAKMIRGLSNYIKNRPLAKN